MGLFHNAWSGWQNYMESGKMIALLPAALLFLWCSRKEKEQSVFLVYASVMTAGCILPVTAALLMRYQTGFYEYKDIWSLVPVTAVSALGAAVFLMKGWGDGRHYRNFCLPAAALMLTAVLFCAMPGSDAAEESRRAQENKRRHAYETVEQIMAFYKDADSDLCLWAPCEIMEYAREADGRILLPYGRNMWDPSLSGYTYDSYGECQKELYLWMEQRREEWTASMAEEIWPDLVQEAGVNCILLPKDADREVVAVLEEKWECQAQPLLDYLLFLCRR